MRLCVLRTHTLDALSMVAVLEDRDHVLFNFVLVAHSIVPGPAWVLCECLQNE